MNLNYKGSLQEYCQNRRLPLPIYQLLKQSGPPHAPRFQVKIGIDNQWFIGKDLCWTKKEAEQSAAYVAYNALNSVKYFIPPKRSSLPVCNSMKHMPPQYADSENFIINIINLDGGRIRKIWAPDEQGRFQFEITDTYRDCQNVSRHHKKNHICFIVDPVHKTYSQKCHDPKCFGFESAIKTMPRKQEYTPVKRISISSTNNSTFPKRFKREIE